MDAPGALCVAAEPIRLQNPIKILPVLLFSRFPGMFGTDPVVTAGAGHPGKKTAPPFSVTGGWQSGHMAQSAHRGRFRTAPKKRSPPAPPARISAAFRSRHTKLRWRGVRPLAADKGGDVGPKARLLPGGDQLMVRRRLRNSRFSVFSQIPSMPEEMTQTAIPRSAQATSRSMIIS